MRNGNAAATGKRDSPGWCLCFSSQRKLGEKFLWSANLRARGRPREVLEIALEAGSKTEELMRLILLKSGVADKN